MAAARRAGAAEGLDDDGNALRNDLIGNLDSAEGGEGEGPEGDEGDSDGETDQNCGWKSRASKSKGRGGRPLRPEEIRKLLEQGAQIKPVARAGRRRGRGDVPDPAHGQAGAGARGAARAARRDRSGLRSWPAGADARAQPGFVLLIRRMGLRAGGLPAQLVPAARDPARRRRRAISSRNTLRALLRDAAAGAPPLSAHPARFVSDGPRARGRRGTRPRTHWSRLASRA